MAFIIFFSIVLSVYALVNYYIFARGLQAIPQESGLRTWFPFAFWGLAATYIIGRFLERIYLSWMSDTFVWVGSFWLAAMLYFFLFVFIMDLMRLSNHFMPWFPEWVKSNYTQVKYGLFGLSVVSTSLLLVIGHINTLHPVHRVQTIEINKTQGESKEIRAVLLSDIHLGTLIGNGHFEKIVNKVQSIEPDIILLAGDILDEDLEPVIRQNIGKTLKQLNAPLGVYGVMGNHEYIGGAEPAYEYLSKHGIQMLRDTVILINDAFYLLGREDREKNRFSGGNRISLESLVAKANTEYPIILMDHQPYYLKEAAELGVDLQVSGHTHNGQLWPLNFITSAIFDISNGYGKIGNMHAYVSNGVGTWGPPVRVGNRPEIVELIIRINQD